MFFSFKTLASWQLNECFVGDGYANNVLVGGFNPLEKY